MTLREILFDLLVEEDVFEAKGAIASKTDVSCRLEIFERLCMTRTCRDVRPSPLACSWILCAYQNRGTTSFAKKDNNIIQGLQSHVYNLRVSSKGNTSALSQISGAIVLAFEGFIYWQSPPHGGLGTLVENFLFFPFPTP